MPFWAGNSYYHGTPHKNCKNILNYSKKERSDKVTTEERLTKGISKALNNGDNLHRQRFMNRLIAERVKMSQLEKASNDKRDNAMQSMGCNYSIDCNQCRRIDGINGT